MESTNIGQPSPASAVSSSKAASFVDKSAILILFAASIALNFFLIARVHTLSQKTSSHPLLTVGAEMPSIEAQTVTGVPGTIDYAATSVPTVLYVFTPQCGWCKRNLPDLHALADQAGNKYRLIGLSLTDRDLKQYIDSQHLDFPVYTHLSSATMSTYQLGGTPATIVISPQGKILNSWVGVYGDDIKGKIESSLQVSLPGCCKS
ncbi:TlpA disulfide reductase family protein [Granulicella sp. S156]|uniref:TlpA family protein disulfide reductase n=1 Tax=Granulicella sp. S156 TaxID=1747224 RepID=UPI00131DDCE6|nr:TlpA disulfide reductase family protein [Granulicella sp. S156]